jgi:predicted  nucleic acid-binding Zn ribbon protein
MYLAKITFPVKSLNRRQREALEDAAEVYLIALKRNLQIHKDFLLGWSKGCLEAHTYVERPSAFEPRYHSSWATRELGELIDVSGKQPRYKIVDEAIPKRFRSWKRSTSFFLSTNAFGYGSPLRCGDTGETVPVFLLPVSDKIRDSLYSWAGMYRHYGNLYISSMSLEIAGYKQIADHQSESSDHGRGLCTEIEKATNRPTYYYLDRYWGRREGENTRPCPGCGRKWRTSSGPGEERQFHQFPFRCEPCRLVSHPGDVCDDERHARIGEFRPK